MASLKNIRLYLENGSSFDYENAEELGIKLNKIVDDFQKPEKKILDYSFSFNLPKTRTNTKLLGYPDTKGVQGIFTNKTFDVRLVAGNEEILNGILELESITDSYQCSFYNKFSELIDEIKGKKLRTLTSLSLINWDYERTIVNHINSNQDISTTDYQFPFCFYRTFHGDGGIPAGIYRGIGFKNERDLFLHNFFSVGGIGDPTIYDVVYYYQQFPPSVYLVSVLNAIINEAGWTLSSTLFERPDIKKIIIPFLGSVEDYQKAIYSGTTGNTILDINKTLPDMNQDEFLKFVVQTYNLYLQVDGKNKVLTLETWDTYFLDNSNPLNIDNLVISDIPTKAKEKGNTAISFETDDNNNFPTMYGRVLDYNNIDNQDGIYFLNTNNYFRTLFDLTLLEQPYDANVYSSLWTKSGTNGEIKLKLSPTNYAPLNIVNRIDINGNEYVTDDRLPDFLVGIPFLSSQTPTDNKGNLPVEEPDDVGNWITMNDPTKWQYNGKGIKLLYYYGQYSYNAVIPSNGVYSNWIYVNIATGGTGVGSGTTYSSVALPIASPYQLLTKEQYEILKTSASEFTEADKTSIKGAEFHYLSLVYHSVGSTGGTHTENCTSFSLNFSDSTDLQFPNLYNFHKNKYLQVNNTHSIAMNIRCTSLTWKDMSIDRTIQYDKELYRIVHIKNYDIAKETAQIKLLKK